MKIANCMNWKKAVDHWVEIPEIAGFPHFFFNTLNNIYSLTLEKSDRAPQVVLRLSELMRYLLYATDKPYQDLTKEIECIQNYIDLERIRFDNTLKIDMNISGDIEGKGIAPMLLMPFIENSFKHGASKNIGKMYIKINLEVIDDVLNFEISNNIPQNKSRNPINPEVGGIDFPMLKTFGTRLRTQRLQLVHLWKRQNV